MSVGDIQNSLEQLRLDIEKNGASFRPLDKYQYSFNKLVLKKISSNESSIKEILRAVEQIKDKLDIKDDPRASLGVLNPSFQRGEDSEKGKANECKYNGLYHFDNFFISFLDQLIFL